ncbi:hypothetical protein AMS62_27780 [Bacillus sp. FJAT-18019]|nr:hypothetical protein AMS62_27780 [Bacillus sp. FJAT-18019]
MAEKFIDAAVAGEPGTNVAYFFLTDQYVVYDYAAAPSDRVKDGVYPLTIFPPGAATGFPSSSIPAGPSTQLDAALRGKGRYLGSTYFFRSDKYMRFRWSPAPPAFDPNHEREISLWNLPDTFSNIDAAFNGALNREAFCYFFKGNKYIRYIWERDSVDQNYPKPISNMVGMPATFAAGIDAVVDGGGSFADRGYLFKEDRYVAFQWVTAGEPHVVGGIQSIQENWTGLAELLLAGKAKSQALEWLHVAREQLAKLVNGTLSPADQALMMHALATHFHIGPTDTARITHISNTFVSVQATLRDSARLFRFRTDDEAVADGKPNIDAAYTGPWPPSAATRINFTRNFRLRSERNRASSVIHEAVHVNDARSDTPSSHINEWYVSPALAPTLGLTPILSDRPEFARRYDEMIADDAIHNPASYATFARHLFFRADSREMP